MKTRYASFPLDCRALEAANRALWKKHPELKGRKLTMDPSDYKYRKEWMDEYIKAEGKAQSSKPQRKPDAPITSCPEPAPKDSPPPPPPPPPPKKDVQCALISIDARCEHTRLVSASMILEVVPGKTLGADQIQLQAKVQSLCGSKHPEWSITGEPTKKGLKTDFRARGVVVEMLIPWIPTIRPNKYHVGCQCCNGAGQSLAVHAYPSKELEVKLDLKKTAKWVYTIIKGIEWAVEIGAEKFQWKVLEGAASAKAQWKEHTDWRAYYAYELSAKFDPLLGIECKISVGSAWITGKVKKIPWLGKYVQKVIDWLIKAGVYLLFAGGINLEYKWERRSPDERLFGKELGKGAGVSGKIKVALGVEGHAAGDKIIAVQAELLGEVTAGGEPFHDAAGFGLDKFKCEFSGLKGEFKIKLLDGWIEDTEAVTFIEARNLYGPTKVYLLKSN